MPPDLVKLMVTEVDVAVPAGPGVEAGMVVLCEVEEPRRRLKIIIAKAEARAIHSAWTGSIPSRPSTWDLYVSTVALLDARVDRVVITAVEEDRHFFANLEVDRAGERRVLACRPSDAIAIALRAYGAEITCVPEVVDTAGLATDGTKFGPWTWPETAAPPEPAAALGGTVGSAPAGALPGDPAVSDAAAPPAPASPTSDPAPAEPAPAAKKARPVKKAAPAKKAPAKKKAAPAKKEAAPAKKKAAVRKAPAKKKAPATEELEPPPLPPDAGDQPTG